MLFSVTDLLSLEFQSRGRRYFRNQCGNEVIRDRGECESRRE